MGGNKLSLPADKRIVIVGGGYGGATFGSKLLKENHPNFTLIDGREAMHHNIASGRAALDTGFIRKTFIPFKPTFADHFKRGIVSNIKPSEKRVVLQTGEELPYDVLVVATGTGGPFPVKLKFEDMDEAIHKYEEMAGKIKNANTITVVGGGAAGIEFASEIKSEYPDKNVTMIHSHNKILEYPKITDAFREAVLGIMDRIKVAVILGERVNNLPQLSVNGPGKVETSGGKKIDSDLVIKCTGLKVNSSAYANSPLASSMEESGALKVDSYLQVEGHEDVFALGDCNNTPENKLGMAAETQAGVLIENMKKKYNQQEMVPYKPGSLPFALVLAFGRNSGLTQFAGGSIMWESLAKKMKASGMQIDMIWKTFNQKPPSD